MLSNEDHDQDQHHDQHHHDQHQKPPQRVVSLLGAATETMYRLGLGDRLVGRSHECDYPPAVLSLPCISRPRLDVDASSSAIDAAVRERSAAGEPIYKLDDEVLSTLVGDEEAPLDLIIAQDHCRVCAITPDDVNQSQALACSNVQQLILKPSTLADCLGDIHKIAAAMGVVDRGIALCATLEERMDRVRVLTRDLNQTKRKANRGGPPRVALLEWCDPIMGCGYWLPEIVEVAGGQALNCPPPGGATPTISFQTLLDSKPDVVIFALCGFGLSRAASEIANSSMWNKDRIEQLHRVCGGAGAGNGNGTCKMFVVDGNYLVNRSGPRVVESCEAIAEAIHPELRGHFGHFGTELLTSFEQAMVLAESGAQTGSAKVRPPPLLEETTVSTAGSTGNDWKEKETPAEGPAKVVAVQLKYLSNGEIDKAFSINSHANQDRWCVAERFEAVLRSHGDFQRLLTTTGSAIVGTVEEKGGIATVQVSLPPSDKNDSNEGRGGVELLWTMIAETPGSGNHAVWRTEKVGVV